MVSKRFKMFQVNKLRIKVLQPSTTYTPKDIGTEMLDMLLEKLWFATKPSAIPKLNSLRQCTSTEIVDHADVHCGQ